MIYGKKAKENDSWRKTSQKSGVFSKKKMILEVMICSDVLWTDGKN